MDPIILAGGIIIREDSLLALHRNQKNWFEIPGGKVEAGETLEATVIRELQEELSLKVTIIRKLGEKAFEQDEKNFQYHWFLAAIPEAAEINIPPKEAFSHDYYQWLPLNKLNQFQLSPNLANFNQSYRSGELKL